MENDRNTPATKGDLEDQEARIIEAIRHNQTEVLKAFFSFAESNQARLTETERESAALKERMGILEKRLTDVERTVNFPDHPTQ